MKSLPIIAIATAFVDSTKAPSLNVEKESKGYQLPLDEVDTILGEE